MLKIDCLLLFTFVAFQWLSNLACRSTHHGQILDEWLTTDSLQDEEC